MSFYINDFKQHLQGLANDVEHPYDEPASREKNHVSMEETYNAMTKTQRRVSLSESSTVSDKESFNLWQ